MNDFDTYREFAIQLATESGRIISEYFHTGTDVSSKEDATPVTIADVEAEQVMRQMVESRFPEHGFFGEETGKTGEESEYVWMVDPIDGTKSFISGSFDFGTVIALMHKREPILGVINQPVMKSMLVGDGQTATMNGTPIRVRELSDVSDAVLVATDLLNVGEFQDPQGFDKLCASVKFARTWGNCFGYGLLATGSVDIMVDPIVAPWDMMGLIPIIRGAGGEITDWHGGPPVLGDSIVAANKTIHPRVIRILGQNSRT